MAIGVFFPLTTFFFRKEWKEEGDNVATLYLELYPLQNPVPYGGVLHLGWSEEAGRWKS